MRRASSIFAIVDLIIISSRRVESQQQCRGSVPGQTMQSETIHTINPTATENQRCPCNDRKCTGQPQHSILTSNENKMSCRERGRAWLLDKGTKSSQNYI